MKHAKSIIILDFGGQYAHLIASRVRRAGVFSEIKDAETPAEELKYAAGIILSGGPQSVYDPNSPQGDPKIFDLGVPVLGICYGLQWMTQTLGGKVSEGKTKEYGKTEIEIEDEEWNAKGNLPKKYTVWMSHGDEVSQLPEGFRRVATSDACKNAGIADFERNIFGMQFHPEVTHTEHGDIMLKNFVDLCDADPWSMKSYAEQIAVEIAEEVGDRKVFMLVSGGVDSSVAFVLLNQVLGAERVQGLLVDTGLMRKNEVADLRVAFKELGITNLYIEDASEEFFANLKDVYDPEEKRGIIGQTFLDVQKRVSEEMNLVMEGSPSTGSGQSPQGGDWMLGQGTIYPDTIETGATKHADKIKTHHNRIEAVQKMIDQGLVIEPLKDLYKDEVRELGEELGLPHAFVWRHPFPGPGLGVRILCSADEEKFEFSMSHAVLPIKSVGVQGDGRTYRHAIALFNDDPTDISEEHWNLSVSIPNSSPDLNRVLFCTSHSKPAEFVFSPGYITPERADLLREADAIVHDEMVKAGLYEKIWQFPVVLLPFGAKEGGQSIVLRPIDSTDAMTANATHLPAEVLQSMTEKIMALEGIDFVFLDMTNKPPGTIEWE